MSAYQLPLGGSSQALAVSDSSNSLSWVLDRTQYENATQTGGLPQYLRVSNVGSVTAYLAISNNVGLGAVVPGSSVAGNTIPVAPNSFIDIQLFGQSGPASSIFNDGNGNCFIAAITVEGTTILVLNALQVI